MLRFIASVMIVSGGLLLVDAGLTVAWQEPISAFLNGREQGKLKRQFKDPTIAARVIRRRPLTGDAIGKIELPTLDKSYFVVEGTDPQNLTRGPGHYPQTALPGRRGTVAIAGHRTTHGAPFRHISDLDRGDRIVLEMPYGTFTYRVERTRIVEPTNLGVIRNVGYPRLVLSACHPLYSAAKRIIVFARLVRRGPPVVAQAPSRGAGA